METPKIKEKYIDGKLVERCYNKEAVALRMIMSFLIGLAIGMLLAT